MNKQAEIIQAVTILKRGGLVAFPTETVYGLGADACNPAAIAKIFIAKGRPADHPLIVHLANRDELDKWAVDVSADALRLAEAFWPGPLTLILKKQQSVLAAITSGQETVGLRVPQHPIAQALLHAFGGGIAAPSANQFTHISPTSASAVREELGNQVDLILDGGDCALGLESTIVDLSSEQPQILRPGMITAEMIARVLEKTIPLFSANQSHVLVPGRHPLHYAPTTKTQLIETTDVPRLIKNLTSKDLPLALMVYSDIAMPTISGLQMIKMPNSASAYAHGLYQTLRSLDHQQMKGILIEMVPMGADWEAIQDRIMKASSSAFYRHINP